MARHVHAVAERIGAQQRGARIVTEDVDQRAGIDRIDVLGIERQPSAREPVGDPRMNHLQALDRGEETERAAACRLDQAGISAGELRHVAPLQIGDDQHLAILGIIERTFGAEMRGRLIEMAGAGPGLGPCPSLGAAERCRGDDDAVRRLQDGFGKRARRIEPAPVDADIIFTSVGPLDGKPVDEVRVGWPAEPRGERDPGRQGLRTPGKAADRPLDARAGLRVQPIGRILEHRFEALGQGHERPQQMLHRLDGRRGRLDQIGIELGDLGLQSVSRILRRGARIDRPPHRREQRLQRAERRPLPHALQPSVPRKRPRRLNRRVERQRARFVIGRDVAQPGGKAAPAPARLPFGADQPPPELDRLLPGQRRREGGIGRIEQVMALVEDDPRRTSRFPPARGIDHHQRVVGDHDVGVGARSRRSFDEAFAVMRAAGIDAFAAPVGERRGAGAAEEGRQPSRHVAAHHVSVAGIGGPPRHQLRQDRCPPGKAALKSIFEVEQAKVIFPPFADHHLALALVRIGKDALAFAVELPLQRLGEGRHPDRAVRFPRPERGGREIAQGLADPGARFGQQQVRLPLDLARRESSRRGGGIIALPFPRLGSHPREPRQPLHCLVGLDPHRPRLGARAILLPLGKPRKQPPLVPLGAPQPVRDGRRPGPAQPIERLSRGPGAFPLPPIALHAPQQRFRGLAEKKRGLAVALGRIETERMRQAFGRRHREASRVDEGEQLEQIEPRKLRVAEPLPDERSVQHDQRVLGRQCDRLAPAERFDPAVGPGRPDAAMGCVERAIGQKGRHPP